jgi:hypothetical protein
MPPNGFPNCQSALWIKMAFIPSNVTNAITYA